jgi:type III pantothenate kinase
LFREQPVPRDLTLAIDVGNSRIKFGLFDCVHGEGAAPGLPAAVAVAAVPAAEHVDWRKIAAMIDEHAARVSSAVIAGANPAGVEMIRSTWPSSGWGLPRVVSRAVDLPLHTSVGFPDKVGIDRLLNAVAANSLRPADQRAIIISAGTATTVDLISEEGTFAGGAILPGLEIGAKALHEYTALLPMIDVPDLLKQEQIEVLGRDTRTAISSGLWFGQLGAIREIVRRLAASATKPWLVLVTGGNGCRLAADLGGEFRFESELALRGLALVAQFEGCHAKPMRAGNAP